MSGAAFLAEYRRDLLPPLVLIVCCSTVEARLSSAAVSTRVQLQGI